MSDDLTPKQLATQVYMNELTTVLGYSDINSDLLNKIITKLGVAAYDTTIDAALVSGSDQTEKDRVITNLLVRDLGMDASEDLGAILDSAITKYGQSNPRKYRVPTYYVIITDLGKETEYLAL